MAKEITDNDLIGAQTLVNITQRAQERGLEVRRDDVRFVLEVVSEADPWFEQGASANLFAGRFRNFVVARCRGQGLNLSADELDLIDAWFAGAPLPQAGRPARRRSRPCGGAAAAGMRGPRSCEPRRSRRAAQRWWSLDDGARSTADAARRRPQVKAHRRRARSSRASCARACADKLSYRIDRAMRRGRGHVAAAIVPDIRSELRRHDAARSDDAM